MTDFQALEVATPGAPNATSLVGPSCTGDLNSDGTVNVIDLLAIISAWGPCADPGNCPADIAPSCGDDVVNVLDLLAIISAWGPCA